MVKSLTIGLVDDGVATWNPVSDGNLLVTGGAGCGKTWWLTHTLIPGLNEMGQRVYMFDGYVDRGYTKPVQGVIPVNDPTSILEEPDSFLIIDHVNPGLEDDSALMETVRESDARIPIILSVQLVPDREQWSAWGRTGHNGSFTTSESGVAYNGKPFSRTFTSFRAGMPGISMPGGTAPSFRSKSSFIIRA